MSPIAFAMNKILRLWRESQVNILLVLVLWLYLMSMTYKRKGKVNTFPLDREIELVVTKGDKCFKKVMTYDKALRWAKLPGYRYQYCEVGFCSLKENI